MCCLGFKSKQEETQVNNVLFVLNELQTGRKCPVCFDVIFQKRVRAFHRDIQTQENFYCFRVFGDPGETRHLIRNKGCYSR